MSEATNNNTKAGAPVSARITTMPTRGSITPLQRVENMQELFDHPEFKKRIMAAAPKHMSAERLLRTFVMSIQKTPKLMKVSPLSMMGAFMTCATLGLEPGTPLQHVHLIPFDVNWNPKTRKREYVRTDVNLIIGYPGYLELSERTGKLGTLHCDVVWERDEFEFSYGSTGGLRHKPRGLRDKDETPAYAYMYAKLDNGGERYEVLTWADVMRVRAGSQGFQAAMYAHDAAKNDGKDPWKDKRFSEAPWIKHEIPMSVKTAFRAGQKWLPKSIELATALAMDEAGDADRVDFSKIIDGDAVLSGDWEREGADPETGEITHEQKLDLNASVGLKDPAKPEAEKVMQNVQTEKQPTVKNLNAQKDRSPSAADDLAGRFGDEQWQQQAAAAQGHSKSLPTTVHTPATTAPATLEDASSEVGMEYYLSDQHDSMVEEVGNGGQFTDPLEAAKALVELIRTNPNHVAALIENNREVIADMREGSQEAAALLDQVMATGLGPQAIPVPNGRGDKPDQKAYIKVVVDDLENWGSVADLMKWEVANRETVEAQSQTTRLMVKKAWKDRLAKVRPNGAEPAAAVAEPITAANDVAAEEPEATVQEAAPVETPAATQPTEEAAAPAAEDPERKRLDDFLSTLGSLGTITDLNFWGQSTVVKTVTARWKANDRTDLCTELQQAFDAHAAKLRGQGPR